MTDLIVLAKKNALRYVTCFAGLALLVTGAFLSYHAQHRHQAHADYISTASSSNSSGLQLQFTSTIPSQVDVKIINANTGATDADFSSLPAPATTGGLLTISGQAALASLNNTSYYNVQVTPTGYESIVIPNVTGLLSGTILSVEAAHPFHVGDFLNQNTISLADIDLAIADYNLNNQSIVSNALGHTPTLGNMVQLIRGYNINPKGEAPPALCAAGQGAPASSYTFECSPSGATTYSFTDAARNALLVGSPPTASDMRGQLATSLTRSVTFSSSCTGKTIAPESEETTLLNTCNPEIDTRDIANAALDELAVGDGSSTSPTPNPGKANLLLEELFGLQNETRLNADGTPNLQYGQIPWCMGASCNIHDYNSDEFANEAIGPILYYYQSELDPTLVANMKSTYLPASINALKVRLNGTITTGTDYSDPCPQYTNMCLMTVTNLILESEVIGDNTDAQLGYGYLDTVGEPNTWINYVKANGITEYDSPTYYATDLESLYMGYLCTTNSTIKAEYKSGLDYFWSDIAANDFMPTGVLAGAHSRDYDFIDSEGNLDYYMILEGLRPNTGFTTNSFEEALIYLSESAAGTYHPSTGSASSITSLAVSGERSVWQDWASTATDDHETYMNGDYAIGTASNDYTGVNQDKQFSLDLLPPAGTTLQAGISVVPVQNGTGDPYGYDKSTDNSGHSKQYHIGLNPVFAQNKNVVLGELEINPEIIKSGSGSSTTYSVSNIENLSTNIILPCATTAQPRCTSTVAGASTGKTNVGSTDLIYDGGVVNVTKGSDGTWSLPVSQGTATFGVLDGKDSIGGYAGAVIRVFHVDSCSGSTTPMLDFQIDTTAPDGINGDDGWDHGAMRLKIAHGCPSTMDISSSSTKPTVPTLKVGILVVAGHFTGDSDLENAVAAVQQTTIDDSCSTTTTCSDWDVKVPSIAGTSLETERSGNTILKRLVNGVSMTGNVFNINGNDAATPIWN